MALRLSIVINTGVSSTTTKGYLGDSKTSLVVSLLIYRVVSNHRIDFIDILMDNAVHVGHGRKQKQLLKCPIYGSTHVQSHKMHKIRRWVVINSHL